jgi:hypothetical protein
VNVSHLWVDTNKIPLHIAQLWCASYESLRITELLELYVCKNCLRFHGEHASPSGKCIFAETNWTPFTYSEAVDYATENWALEKYAPGRVAFEPLRRTTGRMA